MINVLILCDCVSAKLIVTLQDGKYHMGGKDTGVSNILDLIKHIKAEFPNADQIDIKETEEPIKVMPSPMPSFEWEPVSAPTEEARPTTNNPGDNYVWHVYTTSTSMTPRHVKIGETI